MLLTSALRQPTFFWRPARALDPVLIYTPAQAFR